MYHHRPEPTEEDIANKVEQTLLRLRKFGTPATSQDWRVVMSVLIICRDDALGEFVRQGRLIGVGWIVPLAEAILEELNRGNAYRDSSGAVRFRKKPEAEAFKVLE